MTSDAKPATQSAPVMSGALVLEHKSVLRQIVGEAAFQRAWERLPAGHRAILSEASAIGWVPIECSEALFTAAAAEVGREMAALHEQVARTSIEQTLKTLWRLLLRFTSDEALVARTPRIYAKAFQRGELATRILEPGMAEIRVVGWDDMPEYSIRGLRVAIETVLRLAGRKDVRVVSESGARGPAYRATWSA